MVEPLTNNQREILRDWIKECREGLHAMNKKCDRVDRIKELGKKYGVTIPDELAHEIVITDQPHVATNETTVATDKPKERKGSMPKVKYNEHDERILATFPGNDNGKIVVCFDEDAEQLCFRYYDRRAKERYGFSLDQDEWEKVKALEIDEWDNEENKEDDDE